MKELMPFKNVHFVDVEFLQDFQKRNFIFINIFGRFFVFKMKNEGMKIECNLLGKHYFQFSCKESLQITYYDNPIKEK